MTDYYWALYNLKAKPNLFHDTSSQDTYMMLFCTCLKQCDIRLWYNKNGISNCAMSIAIHDQIASEW